MIDAGFHLHLGRVITATPYLNSYHVFIPGVGRVVATASDQGGDRLGTTGGGSSYLPGTTVIVIVPEKGQQHVFSLVSPYIIIDAISVFPKAFNTNYFPQQFSEHLGDYNNTIVYDTIADKDFAPTSRQDRSFNKLLDSLPGDWTKSNALGGIIQIALFLTRIGASPDCCIQFHGIDKTAEITADALIEDTLFYFKHTYKEGVYGLSIEQHAYTTYEGLGGKEGDTVKEVDGKFELQDEKQRSLSRYCSLKGGAVQGEMTFTQTPKKSDKKIYTYDDELLGLTRVLNKGDGIYRIEAAKEIALYKTGAIRVPQQTADTGSLYPEDTEPEEDPYKGMTDVEAKVKELGLASVEEYYAVQSLLKDKIKTFEEEKYFWSGLRQEGSIWVIPPKGEKEIASTQDMSLPPLDRTEPEYSLDKLPDLLTDPIEVESGRFVRLFKNSSSFIMQDDGGLHIGDGFGAGINMDKGTLIFSAPLDIKFQAGRDLISIIPRNEIHKVGENIEFVANKGGVNIKADTFMNLLSGNSGKGAMVIENKADKNTINDASEKDLKNGNTKGSGIYIKAKDASIVNLAKRFSISGHSTSNSDNGLGTERESNECEITIDAGKANLLMLATDLNILHTGIGAFGNYRTATGLFTSADTAMLLGEAKVQFTAPIIGIEKGESNIKRPSLNSSGVTENISISIPASVPSVEVNGSIKTTGVIASKESILSEKAVQANQGCNPNPIATSQRINVVVQKPTITKTKENITKAASAITAVFKKAVKEGMFTDKAHNYTDFCFPDSSSTMYNIDVSKIYFTELAWQRMVKDSGKTWVENAVEHGILGKTYAYPGTEVFADKTPIIRSLDADGTGLGDSKSFDQYITNS